MVRLLHHGAAFCMLPAVEQRLLSRPCCQVRMACDGVAAAEPDSLCTVAGPVSGVEWATDDEVLYVVANKHGRPFQVLPTLPLAERHRAALPTNLVRYQDEQLMMAICPACIPGGCVSA